MKKYLMLGATGFIGSNILRNLPNNIKLTIITTNPKKIEKKINLIPIFTYNYKFLSIKNKKIFQDQDCIINAIGAFPNKNRKKNLKLLNYDIPKKIFDLASNKKYKKFFNCNTILNNRKSRYVFYKHKLSDYLKKNAKNTCVIDMHISNLYGDRKDKKQFINKILRSIELKRKSINLTKGNQLRDFLHIYDFNVLFKKLLKVNFKKKYNRVDVCSFKKYSIKNVVQKIKKISNSKINLNFGTVQHMRGEDFDVNYKKKIYKFFWKPKISLNEGLKKLVNNN